MPDECAFRIASRLFNQINVTETPHKRTTLWASLFYSPIRPDLRGVCYNLCIVFNVNEFEE
ncbi:hypothetical protein LASUN_03540 [Lentilactobacillus sunkii]|jgi:hypothetical protein|uniref:Uncharacterized protein n=1 Tax=Lentilactobacillus sunkii TaxID=481719 RepID=A0A1E7XIM5_9LACO|nr:hypothetical protein LASUN_03540 [Lentilactobacillus sunkii]